MPEPREESATHQAVSLLEELTRAYEQGNTMKITAGALGLLDALNSPDPEVSSAAAIQLHEWGDKLNELVLKDNRFPGNSVRHVRGDGGASAFYPKFVGVPLVRRALQTHSPEAAIEWLQKVLATTAATGNTIHALWGVPVDREIELIPTVRIVPIDALPDSVQKQWLTGYSPAWGHAPISTMLNFEQPKSALMAARRIEPFTYDPKAEPDLTHDEFSQTRELLQDITLALTVVGPRVPISAAQWFTFDDPDLDQASMLSGTRRSQLHEILPNLPGDYPMLDPTEAQQIVPAYLALQGETRHKVRVALQKGSTRLSVATALETVP